MLRESRCSELAAQIAARIGLDLLEVENLLRQGRTAEELLALADPVSR